MPTNGVRQQQATRDAGERPWTALPPGEGSPVREIIDDGPPEQAGQISNFSGHTQRRWFDEQRHDYTIDGLPADNLQVSGGGMGQLQHPDGEFLGG